jgi:GT2 family glycosyltransferase
MMTQKFYTKKTINVIIASHNRASLTVSCIDNLILFAPEDVELRIILVDDGSTDDTITRVRQTHPEVEIISGDGTWFWAKSMSVADEFCADSMSDLLWINDDVRLLPDSLSRTIALSSANPENIIVGQCYSKTNGSLTYGGLVKHSRHPFKYFLVESIDSPITCDTFNGNFIFVPKIIRQVVGPIDGEFGHRFADLDYGLRSLNLGFKNLILPGVVGFCERNKVMPINNPVKRVLQTGASKNLPFKALWRFVKKHGSHGSWIYILFPYLKAFLGVKQREINQDAS